MGSESHCRCEGSTGADPFRRDACRSGSTSKWPVACCLPGMETEPRPAVRDGTSGGEEAVTRQGFVARAASVARQGTMGCNGVQLVAIQAGPAGC